MGYKQRLSGRGKHFYSTASHRRRRKCCNGMMNSFQKDGIEIVSRFFSGIRRKRGKGGVLINLNASLRSWSGITWPVPKMGHYVDEYNLFSKEEGIADMDNISPEELNFRLGRIWNTFFLVCCAGNNREQFGLPYIFSFFERICEGILFERNRYWFSTCGAAFAQIKYTKCLIVLVLSVIQRMTYVTYWTPRQRWKKSRPMTIGEPFMV